LDRSEILPDSTVGSALAWAREKLAQAAIESPQLTAELLLRHVLGWDRARVLTYPETAVTAGRFTELAGLVTRRCAGEPLQYITGKQEFFGLPFRVTPDVLIPRPETEILVEKAIELSPSVDPVHVADVGTGSGCIAVAIAYFVPHARVEAIDLSQNALAVARENAAANRVLSRIFFLRGNLLDFIRSRPRFHMILANPPYISRAEIDTLDPVVGDHEPRMALFGGESGLDLCARIMESAAALLLPGGFLLMEIGAGQAEAVSGLVLKNGLRLDSIIDDLRGIPRCVVAQKTMERTDG
jgi:release factor glutamine methyltransferase